MHKLAPTLARSFSVKRIENGKASRVADALAAEEPLQIRIRHWFKARQISSDLSLTMRTPGHDVELIVGFLFSEGLIGSRDDIIDIRSLGSKQSNEILAELSDRIDVETWRLSRTTALNASCGVCGKRSVEDLARMLRPRVADSFTLQGTAIYRLPESLERLQQGFSQTGGLHAAALRERFS